ncbi:DUF4349 domain-containing protein [Aurantiacibacter gilvus]|uniref:DUF4349 domain-containing protein n=1 Tax=Aurantiacibacter gilvus TaxID=3139141 RepID=A0ABU9IC96_9SPHN
MKLRIILAVPVLAALIGCNAEETTPRAEVERMEMDFATSGDAPTQNFGFMEAMEQGPFSGPSGAESARRAANFAESSARGGANDNEDPAPGTQIAYAYSWGFQVDAADLATLQQRHRDLCDSLAGNCRVLSLSQSGDGDYGYGRMELQVAASEIDAFSTSLNSAGDELDAEQISFAIFGEDLTDDIIDNEARLAARMVLRDRLMEVLRNRQGSVGDLVEAERGVAAVNEEIDATQSRLASLRNRVAYTSVSIEYDPQMGHYSVGFWAPVSEALGSVTTTLGVAVAAVVYLVVGAFPFVLLFFALRWLWRKNGLRLWRRKSGESES